MKRKSKNTEQGSSYEIIPMAMRHIGQVSEIERDVFTDPWSVSMLEDELTTILSKSYVVEIDRRVAGYLNARIVLEECNIINLAVHSAHQRKGIATALFNEITEYARSLNAIVLNLEVRESNKKAIAFYEKMGMKVTGRRMQYYVSPVEDAILMVKFIGGNS